MTPRGRWIDSHCHLQDQYRPKGSTLAQVVEEAAEAGVGGLICVGTDARSSKEAVGLARILRSANVAQGPPFGAWATVGLHPHDAASGTDEIEALLPSLLKESAGMVVAVGECGLDYHYDNSPRRAQRNAFAVQIALARRHGLTLVVHARDAWDDLLDILESEPAPQRIVLHCFTGGPEEARRCLDLGAYLSFSGIITFKNASPVRDALELCPLDRLLVETDAPFLAPVPHRGKENRPAWVSVVGEAAARIKIVDVDELSAATLSATHSAFSLG